MAISRCAKWSSRGLGVLEIEGLLSVEVIIEQLEPFGVSRKGLRCFNAPGPRLTKYGGGPSVGGFEDGDELIKRLCWLSCSLTVAVMLSRVSLEKVRCSLSIGKTTVSCGDGLDRLESTEDPEGRALLCSRCPLPLPLALHFWR